MTIQELSDCLFEVRNQDQEITLDDINVLMHMWERILSLDEKVYQLRVENMSKEYIDKWRVALNEQWDELRNF